MPEDEHFNFKINGHILEQAVQTVRYSQQISCIFFMIKLENFKAHAVRGPRYSGEIIACDSVNIELLG